ncbi:MAG: MoxR family ATPase [Thermoguttaceae bacterium]|nr:MoxR family ATPase [Thermoguttaceae bacterium]MBQ3822637.1 MoxR family ATPase [Thermoguttaceae bacterium]MBQ5367119.1 MoxR family ATPase [Thermoguttaceae bacterium]
MEKVFIGKKEVVRLALTAFFGEGHLLLDDVPGVGKTLLGQALARSLNATFSRIQFTSDLLPSDVVGGEVYRQKTQDFQFIPGPIFANIVLADEVNRTPPRTQSATLEAMSERQVSADGKTYALPDPFFVVATENPVEFEGVYPLPESQLDRFMMRLSIGYPDRESELTILDVCGKGDALASLKPVLSLEQVKEIREAVKEVKLDPAIANYLLDVVDATRASSELLVGASPRASLTFARAARSLALISGRDYVVPDDVKQVAVYVLAHRLIPKNNRREDSRRVVESFVQRALSSVPTP